MLECDQALELISAHIDGALTPEEEQALSEHLEVCPDCRSLLADLEQLHQEMGALSQQSVSPPPQLQGDIMARIRAEARPRAGIRGRGRWRAWVAMAALFAVVLLGAGTLRIWQAGGSGAVRADTAAGGAAAVPTTAQAETNLGDEQAGEEADASWKGSGATGGDAQAVSSPAPAYTGGAALGGGSDGYASASSSSPDAQGEAGQGDLQTIQPRSDAQGANSLPQPFAVSPSPSLEAGSAVTTALSPSYVGVLTLAWEQVSGLEVLEGLSYTVQGDERAYVLPAAEFEALAASLGADGAQSLRREGADISPDAPQGLVLVTGAPSP